MKRIAFGLALIFGLFCMSSGYASEGERIFGARGCSGCHEKTQDTVGPALSTITQKYQKDKAKLIKFFRGEAQPIIWPEKFRIMEPFMNMLKNMDGKDLEALADYIFSH